jgi:N-acetylglucosamine kinase-like BadF-type ATPase
MPFYIGVDGGGTKTAYALFNGREELLALREGPGTNHENLDGAFDEAAARLWEGIQALLRKAGKSLPEIDFTLMGLAGVDHPFQYDALMERLRAYGLARFELCNDGFIVVKAGSRAGAAIGLNLGTGTCCNAIDRRGRRVQLAGLGDFSGDIGNGQWIAAQAFRLIYDDWVLGVAPTALTDMAKRAFSLETQETLFALLPDIEAGGEAARTLIRLFFEAANRGDPPVMRPVRQMAERGAQLIAAHLRTLDFPADGAEVVLSGSIHTKLPGGVYVDLLKQKAEALSGRRLEFIVLEQPPVMGCIKWILQEYVS